MRCTPSSSTTSTTGSTGISARGIEPDERETYENGVRKVTYRDPDGNEIGFGGGPATSRRNESRRPRRS